MEDNYHPQSWGKQQPLVSSLRYSAMWKREKTYQMSAFVLSRYVS